MFDLPYATHQHLIEPINGQSHVRLTLASRFLGFMDQIKKSHKIIPKMLLSHIQCDVRSTTGYNLRKIMLQTDKLNVSELRKDSWRQMEGKYGKWDHQSTWQRNRCWRFWLWRTDWYFGTHLCQLTSCSLTHPLLFLSVVFPGMLLFHKKHQYSNN